jgi:hypothetical protein
MLCLSDNHFVLETFSIIALRLPWNISSVPGNFEHVGCLEGQTLFQRMILGKC